MKYFLLILLLLLSGCTMNAGDEAMDNATQTTESHSIPTTFPEGTSPSTGPELLHPLIYPEDSDFVRVTDYLPETLVELKYGTSDNFTGQVIYDFQEVYLRYGTVQKLKAVSEELHQLGFSLKIWDGFRPVSAQFKLWEICPDDTYVANPNKGYSNHSRGFAVDVTIVDSEGREVEMPTAFDDFSPLADRDYSDCPETAANHARLLETVMEKHGFKGYFGEWWHFNDTTGYEVETCFDPGLIALRQTSRAVPLYRVHWDSGSEILKIPAGEYVTLLGFDEGYALVEYWGYRGYITMDAFR